MAMSLRVVVPPHPLIAHWLTLLRDKVTPPPLYATAMGEMGRWLTYEAIRDWLPQRQVEVETNLAPCPGTVVDPAVPLLCVPLLRGGLGLWQGGQQVVPSALVSHMVLESRGSSPSQHWLVDSLPASIGKRVGVLLFLGSIATGRSALALLKRLGELGVSGDRLRLITSLAAGPGLTAIGEVIPDLTIYCSCIDGELDALQRPVPGIGELSSRLYGSSGSAV